MLYTLAMDPNEDGKWEVVPCPQCGGKDSAPMLNAVPNEPRVTGSFSTARCCDCGLLFANPRLNKEALLSAYEALSGASALFATSDDSRQEGMVVRWWRHATQHQVVGDWVQRGPVLDVGCNNGDLLLDLRARGFEVHGIEMDHRAVENCLARGLNVRQGLIEEVELPKNKYGTILLSHVLEHISDLTTILRKLHGALLPGGRIVIAVPNAAGAVARAFGRHWHGWDPPFHLTHFEPYTLRSVLVKAGFDVTSVKTRGLPDDCTRSLSRLLKRPVGSLWVRMALFPPSWVIGKLSMGGELCAVAERRRST